jgi:hypothetical protein
LIFGYQNLQSCDGVISLSCQFSDKAQANAKQSYGINADHLSI